MSTSYVHSHALLAPAAHVPLFLYPFLNTVSKTRPFEYLRLTSLGVIGALVKVRSIGYCLLGWKIGYRWIYCREAQKYRTL